MSRYVRRNIYLRRGRGYQQIAYNAEVSFDQDEPLVGYVKINGKEYIVEHENRRWIVNPEYTRSIRRKCQQDRWGTHWRERY